MTFPPTMQIDTTPLDLTDQERTRLEFVRWSMHQADRAEFNEWITNDDAPLLRISPA